LKVRGSPVQFFLQLGGSIDQSKFLLDDLAIPIFSTRKTPASWTEFWEKNQTSRAAGLRNRILMCVIIDYDNFFLPADNLETAKEFYQNKLGLALKFDFADRGMVAFKVGKMRQ